jgi:hypothetical protein
MSDDWEEADAEGVLDAGSSRVFICDDPIHERR